jgi:protein TonB
VDESLSRSTLGRFLLASLLLHGIGLGWLHWNAAREPLPEPPPLLFLQLFSELPPAPVPTAPAPVASAPVAPPKTAPEPKPRRAPAPVAPTESARPAPAPAPAVATSSASADAAAQPGAANPSGATQVAALPGVASGPSLEDELRRYEAELARRISAHKHYPALARRRGIEGSVLLRLTIDARGRLEALETPGRAPLVLVSQARSAAERAAPFPPPPNGELKIDFVLRFDLDE